MAAAAAESPLNRCEMRSPRLGIITASITYQYVREVFPEASVLKLGWSFPFPDQLLRTFAEQVQELVVLEELDDFLEERVRSRLMPRT